MIYTNYILIEDTMNDYLNEYLKSSNLETDINKNIEMIKSNIKLFSKITRPIVYSKQLETISISFNRHKKQTI